MHPCLCVDEIVRLLASQLVESGRKSTVLALACCCKNLEDPMLDVLWETQDNGLFTLLRIFSEDIWSSNVCVPNTFVIRSLLT